jgi:hypothetical protein
MWIGPRVKLNFAFGVSIGIGAVFGSESASLLDERRPDAFTVRNPEWRICRAFRLAYSGNSIACVSSPFFTFGNVSWGGAMKALRLFDARGRRAADGC